MSLDDLKSYPEELNPVQARDYTTEAKGLVTQQFKLAEVFNKYVQVMVDNKTELLEVIDNLMQDRSLETAVGAQLDIIGRIVGQERQVLGLTITEYFGFDTALGSETYGTLDDSTVGGFWRSLSDPEFENQDLDDNEYRLIIKMKIIRNSSNGNIDSFLQAAKIIYNVDTLLYEEFGGTVVIGIGRQFNTGSVLVPGLDESALGVRYLPIPFGVKIEYQDPLTFYANFLTQTYQQFIFGSGSGLTTQTLNQMFTFTRPYTDTYFDINGDEQTASTNEPRFGHDELTQEPLGLCINGPNEVLTHTWGFEANESQGTFNISITHDNPSETEVVFIAEGVGIKIILFREDTYWKVRTEWGVAESYEAIITQATSDSIVANISYTVAGVYFSIEDENRFASIVVANEQVNIRNFDMRIGGSFTTNVGDVYEHFNGKITEFSHFNPYTGSNERIVNNDIPITTEEYEKILTEFDEPIVT